MGQYYRAIIYNNGVEDMRFFEPNDYCCGSKLMEHSYLLNLMVNAVMLKIKDTAKIVCWIGDYGNENGDEVGIELYPYVWGDKKNNRRAVNTKKMTQRYLEGKDWRDIKGYLINQDEKEFVDFNNLCYLAPDKDWIIHPLPLLTATSNGRGGGDYHSWLRNYDRVGSWAGTRIVYQDRLPTADYTDITEQCVFEER